MHWTFKLSTDQKWPILRHSNGAFGGLCQQCRRNLAHSRYHLKDLFGQVLLKFCSLDCARLYRQENLQILMKEAEQMPDRRSHWSRIKRWIDRILGSFTFRILFALILILSALAIAKWIKTAK